MITCIKERVILTAENAAPQFRQTEQSISLRKHTMACQILYRHTAGKPSGHLALRSDKLASTENVYVNVLQSARASGLTEFPVPTVLFNDHNSLCSVGGTICEDDHVFGLSCAKHYGGIFVPPFCGIIHQFMRENIVASGDFELATDSHTRYGALGAIGIGEGGGEMVKQLLGQPYCIPEPEVVAVRLRGRLSHGVGPHDVALALIKVVYGSGFVKNKILEFIGEGISNLSIDQRFDIDTMCTETAAISTIWRTDDAVKEFFSIHGRVCDYASVVPRYPVCYDGLIEVDLSGIRPMIALPFHPSNAYTIEEFNANTEDLIAAVEQQAKETMAGFRLRDRIQNKRFVVRQGTVCGCAGGLYENLCAVASILENFSDIQSECRLHLYPASLAVSASLEEAGVTRKLLGAGAIMFPAYCGPCFGAQDIPCNNDMAIRHVTRNFPNREGSRPGEMQSACIAVMDARSIAATFCNGGRITGADTIDYVEKCPPYTFSKALYKVHIYEGWRKPRPETPILKGPNILDWPDFPAMQRHLLLQVSGVYPGTLTTDALLPSGEASAYRSNPERLSAYTLINTDPEYSIRAKKIRDFSEDSQPDSVLTGALRSAIKTFSLQRAEIHVGSVIVGDSIGDGSAREQATSSQRILGGCANLALEYCTSRYRSNLINWGLLPLLRSPGNEYITGDLLLLPDIRLCIRNGEQNIRAFLYRSGNWEEHILHMAPLLEEEREILLAGCLINYNRLPRHSEV